MILVTQAPTSAGAGDPGGLTAASAMSYDAVTVIVIGFGESVSSARQLGPARRPTLEQVTVTDYGDSLLKTPRASDSGDLVNCHRNVSHRGFFEFDDRGLRRVRR